MKQGWEIKKLGEVCETAKNIKWANIPASLNISYIDLSAVDRDSSSITETQLINSSNAPSRAKQIVRYGDVIFATTRPTLRRLCAIPEDYDNAICSTGFCVLRPKKEILTEWIFYTLKCDAYYAYIEPIQKGASYPAVTDNEVKEYTFLMPSLAEQRRIVEILDREFERIDALKVNAERNLQHAKDLFQSALKQELQPKEGWDISTLGDVCDIQGGSTPKRTEKAFWDNGTYPWFTVEDIREQGRIITNTKQKITKLAWDKLRVFPKNTVLLCCTASLGEYALTKIPLTSNQQFNGLSIKDENLLNPMYLLHYCSTLKDKLFTLSGKTTIDFVATGKVKQIEISFPSLVEQGKVVARLDKLKEHCTALEENYKKTIALCDDMKQALLRKAFNGEL